MKMKLLCHAAIAVSRCPTVDDMDVRVRMKIADEARKQLKSGLVVSGFFDLGIGFVGDRDLKPESVLALLGKRFAGDEPMRPWHIADDRRRPAEFLLEQLAGKAGDFDGEALG